MKELELEEHDLPCNPSNKGIINNEIASKIGSIAHSSNHPKAEVEIIEEGSAPSANPPFTSSYNPLLVELPSTTFIDSFSSYRLPPNMYSM
jgi:hypothetical protein